MRIGIVGCGYWGSKHIRVLHGLSEVEQEIAIDPRESRLAELEQGFPSLQTAVALDDVLDSLDAIIVATPPSTHVTIALQALAAGKNVLVEKPMATRSIDALRMIECADANSCVLMAGHTFEYNAAVWKMKELVTSGELGLLYYLDAARLNLGLYQSDVNVIWDLAPHDVSIMNYILGAQPTSVEAWGSRHGHPLLEDVAYLRLVYSDPAVTANIHVSWLDPCKVRRLTVVGSKKMAVYNDQSADERVRVYDKGLTLPEVGRVHDAPLSYRYGDISSPFVAFEEPLLVQDREFVSAIVDRRRPCTDAENGLSVVRTLEAAELSLRERRIVEIDPIEETGSIGEELVAL